MTSSPANAILANMVFLFDLRGKASKAGNDLGMTHLFTVDDLLLEDSVVVSDAVPICRH